jgi:indole-3-glycerol phosphate synthase
MILDAIVAHKKRELEIARQSISLAQLEAIGAKRQAPVDFSAALGQPGVGIIAEVKRASPSRGEFALDREPEELAQIYTASGAVAVSVLTDQQFFRGKLDFLSRIRSRLSATVGSPCPYPLLRKDFLIDPYQVFESYAYGADAILLIVAILSDAMLRELLELSRDLRMSALVEVHNASELARAMANGAEIVGINNRDLRDFSVDLEVFGRLAPSLPNNTIAVAESGVHSPDDVRRLSRMGADAVLVGEALVTAADVGRKVSELVGAGEQLSGIQRIREFEG